MYTFKLQNATEYLLTQKPNRSMFSETPIDDTIRSKSDGGGYLMTLARDTRDVYRYKVVYGVLTDANLAKLEAVHDACGGSEWFYWTHPISGDIKQVIFSIRPNFKKPYISRSRITFELREI